MAQQNRDIFLFFEENADKEVIHNKMVRLYMNRLIIDEEQRFEISNVAKLTKFPKVIISNVTKSVTAGSDLNQRMKKFMEKWSKNKQIILKTFKSLLKNDPYNIDTTRQNLKANVRLFKNKPNQN